MDNTVNLGVLSDPNAPVMPRDGGEDCQYCGNKRYLLDETTGNLYGCPHCRMADKWRIDSLKPFSSLRGEATKQTFFNFRIKFGDKEDPHLRDCLEVAEDFAEAPDGKWLVIVGAWGTGKSHLCAAVANDLLHRDIAALFITMPELLASLIQAREIQANTEQETYSGRLDMFKKVPVLILDDLGAETATSWSDGVMFELLDYRYRNRLSTMLATNLPLDEFDPRIASRMQDVAFCTVIENAAADYRKRTLIERNEAE